MLFCLALPPIPNLPPIATVAEPLLRDRDYLRLQFLGSRDASLSCEHNTCGFTKCLSSSEEYLNFNNQCWSTFQIIGEGTSNAVIRSGQRIRLRAAYERNLWVGCPSNNKCDKRTCPGTISEGSNFTRCHDEIFRIYSRATVNGLPISNGDLVMLYYPNNGKYVSIQGKYLDQNSLDFCPGMAPPAYLSYAICSKNVFRIHRKP